MPYRQAHHGAAFVPARVVGVPAVRGVRPRAASVRRPRPGSIAHGAGAARGDRARSPRPAGANESPRDRGVRCIRPLLQRRSCSRGWRRGCSRTGAIRHAAHLRGAGPLRPLPWPRPGGDRRTWRTGSMISDDGPRRGRRQRHRRSGALHGPALRLPGQRQSTSRPSSAMSPGISTSRLGLAERDLLRAGRRAGNAVRPTRRSTAPFSMNVSMNIADKRALYSEIHRVLKPGARLGLAGGRAGAGRRAGLPDAVGADRRDELSRDRSGDPREPRGQAGSRSSTCATRRRLRSPGARAPAPRSKPAESRRTARSR